MMKSYYGCLNYYHNNCKIKSITTQHIKKEHQTDRSSGLEWRGFKKNKWLPNILYSCIIKCVAYPLNNHKKYFKN